MYVCVGSVLIAGNRFLSAYAVSLVILLFRLNSAPSQTVISIPWDVRVPLCCVLLCQK